MQNSCIFSKSFEENCTIYTKSEPLEMFMGSDTKNVIDKPLNTLLQRFQRTQETSNEREASSFLIVLNYYFIIFKEKTLEELNYT